MNPTRSVFSIVALLPALALIPLLAVFGVRGMTLEVVLFGTLVVLYLLFRFNVHMLGLAVLLLGVSPFYWGLDLGGLPKVFADEALFLLYAGYFLLTYLIVHRKSISMGDSMAAATLGALVLVQFFGFLYNGTSYVAFRNFIETYVFGMMLYFLFANEVDEQNVDFLINIILAMTLLLALAMVIEKITNYNFFMSRAKDVLYLSPELSKITKGVYRPYVTFFHPSEAGTFVAMGLPFVFYRARKSKGISAVAMTGLVLLSIIVNYTRGVWLAVAVTATIFIKRLRWHLLYLAPLSLILLVFIATLFQDLPFAQRLTDPKNLLARFFYWDLAWDIFKEHFLIGIGHMNFKEVYLSYIRTISSDVQFDVNQLFVADSVFLTTMVEAGLLGLVALLTFWTAVVIRLQRLARYLHDVANSATAALPTVCLQSISIYLVAGLLADLHQFTKITKFAFIIVGIGFALGKSSEHQNVVEADGGLLEQAEVPAAKS